MNTKILLVEKNLMLSRFMTEELNSEDYFYVMSHLKDERNVVNYLSTNFVDVLIMDFFQTNGLELVGRIKKQFPELKIICFSTMQDGFFPNRIVELGASIYLSKYDTNIKKMKQAIRQLVTTEKLTC